MLDGPGLQKKIHKTLAQQARTILRYLDSAYPAQIVIPPKCAELLRRTLKKEKP